MLKKKRQAVRESMEEDLPGFLVLQTLHWRFHEIPSTYLYTVLLGLTAKLKRLLFSYIH